MSAAVSRQVVKKVLSVETPEGAGALVRRSIGTPALKNLTPFLMLDHFHVAKGAGFPDHPHRGMSTVTYMLEGTSKHEDSAGHAGTIETGGVQWMVAGKGILHAEMPVHADDKPEPRGLQLWVDLPEQYKMVDPTYQELGPTEIPTAYPDGPDGAVKIKVISGESHGVVSPVRPLGGCHFYHFIIEKKGTTVFQPIPEGWTSFSYIWRGSINVGSNPANIDTFHTLVLSASGGETGVSITSTADHTEFVIVAGEPLKGQGIVQYGPFVMTSVEGIQQTLRDYQTSSNGFEKAGKWKSVIGGQ